MANLIRRLVGRARSAAHSGAAIAGALRSLQGESKPSTADKPVKAKVESAMRAQIIRPKKSKPSKAKVAYRSPTTRKIPGLKGGPGTGWSTNTLATGSPAPSTPIVRSPVRKAKVASPVRKPATPKGPSPVQAAKRKAGADRLRQKLQAVQSRIQAKSQRTAQVRSGLAASRGTLQSKFGA